MRRLELNYQYNKSVMCELCGHNVRVPAWKEMPKKISQEIFESRQYQEEISGSHGLREGKAGSVQLLGGSFYV